MSQVAIDLLYGARRFNTIAVRSSELAVQFITRVKKWKRLNRPPKTKTSTFTVPGMYQMGDTIIAHPKIIKLLKRKD